MLRIYCQKCGNANGYISEKPNFCQKCGEAFGAVKRKSVAKAQAPTEDDSPVDLPDLEDGLEFDIETFDKGGDTLGNIMGTQQGSTLYSQIDNVEEKGEEMSKEQFLEMFQREAGSIRGGKGKKT